jgi:hypothetical protein
MEMLLAVAVPLIIGVLAQLQLRQLNRCSMRIMHRRHRRTMTLESLFSEPAQFDNDSPTDHLTRHYGDN